MEILRVDRVDHHGIVAGTIKDLGLIQMIDDMLGRHPEEKISAGEAVAGMIINGLGFTDRPMTLTPQFFENCPVELLFREGVSARDFNRFKLGRTLDNIFEHGCDVFFSQLAEFSCKQEGIDTRFCHLDTTSFSFNGQYSEEKDEKNSAILSTEEVLKQECQDTSSFNEILTDVPQAIKITHGYSKDHRPDLKQVVLELIVSQDSGVPFLSKAWDGNTSDNEIFTQRTNALIEAFKKSETPKFLIADSKLYGKSNSENLNKLSFITRIPDTISEVNNLIQDAISDKERWSVHSEKRKYQEFEITHYGIKQRWIVVFSSPAENRAKENMGNKVAKEKELLEKELFHIQAERFSCESDARKALDAKSKKWKYHLLGDVEVQEHRKYSHKGRPKPGETPDQILYQIVCTFKENSEEITKKKENNSCYVLGTNVPKDTLSAKEIIDNYSEQQSVERGFRFLKDPVFFTSAFFIKKTSRIQAMLVIMTLALMVYAIAERRLRNFLTTNDKTIPNQIEKEIQNPTLRWIFQLLDGISRVKVKINDQIIYSWTGLTELRLRILSFFCQKIMVIYKTL